MKRGIAAVCVLAGMAGEAEAGPVHAPKLLKGPYLQDLAPTSIKVMWQLEEPRPARLIVSGPGGERVLEVAAGRLSEAAVEGLVPASRYRYRVVVDDRSWEGQFATAPPIGKDVPFSFAVIGDTRYGVEQHRRIVERVVREAPDFVLGTGDMVDEGSRQDQWQQFFDVEAPLLRDHVYYPSVGNHDRQGRGRTADSYRTYFSVPDNGGETERYYAFTYASARVLVLDSNIYSFALTDQTAWIERELVAARQDPSVHHIFVVMHHPPFSISLHGGAKDLRERWAPLFEKFGVSAVFSGHDHVYERAEHNGVRYFVSGGGGAPLYPKRPRSHPIDVEAVQRFERAFHYLRVAVTGRKVEVTGIRIDGTTIEATAWSEGPVAVAQAAQAAPVVPVVPVSSPSSSSSPLPAQPVAVEASAPVRGGAAGGAKAAVAAVGVVPPIGGAGGTSRLWVGLLAVGGLLGAAVVVVRTLRR
jgi:predicted phosphodiesterase